MVNKAEENEAKRVFWEANWIVNLRTAPCTDLHIHGMHKLVDK